MHSSTGLLSKKDKTGKSFAKTEEENFNAFKTRKEETVWRWRRNSN
jgi:hypothetical protein